MTTLREMVEICRKCQNEPLTIYTAEITEPLENILSFKNVAATLCGKKGYMQSTLVDGIDVCLRESLYEHLEADRHLFRVGTWFWGLNDGCMPVGPFASQEEAVDDAQKAIAHWRGVMVPLTEKITDETKKAMN